MNPGTLGFPPQFKGRLRVCTVAELGGGREGDVAFAKDCRVFDGAGTREGSGVGSGGMVTCNASGAWKIAGTNVTAAA